MKLKPPFKLNVPMVLTWARIAMIPLVMGVFYLPHSVMPIMWQNIIACVIFVIAAVTDALDGFLARRYEGWATRMGAFLDPIADKLTLPPRSSRSAHGDPACPCTIRCAARVR